MDGSNTFKKVRDGEKLRIPARTYNAMIDAAQDYANRKSDRIQSGHSGAVPSNIVLVKNTSGVAVGRLCVLGISNSLISVSSNQFKEQMAFVGVVPLTASHGSGRFVITVEPIAHNSLGRAIVTGVCQVQINVTDGNHSFADITNNDVTKLTSAETGPATILWKEAGTGTKWAVIRFGGSGGGSSVQLAIVTQEPEYNNALKDRYIVQKCSLVGGVYTGDTIDIAIDRVLGYEGYPNPAGLDIRNYIPWYKVNSIVRIVQQWDVAAGALKWFLDMPLIFAGAETDASLRWNPTDGLAQAVWG